MLEDSREAVLVSLWKGEGVDDVGEEMLKMRQKRKNRKLLL